MSVTTKQRVVHVALVGNPNTGKSTLFNALCGMRQRVGNYPGVTVEKKIGRCEFDGSPCNVIDLPGSYSLAPRSPDEMIAVDVLLGLRDDIERPDAVICIVDASNLERNLYLVSQVLELNLPTVVALNMGDIAHDKGVAVDVSGLRQRLSIPVVEIQANRKRGLSELRRAVAEVLETQTRPVCSPFPAEFQQEIGQLENTVLNAGNGKLPRYLLERLLLDSNGFLEQAGIHGVTEELMRGVQAARDRLNSAGLSVPAVEAISRYQWVADMTAGLISRTAKQKELPTDQIDRVLTHRVCGLFVFFLVVLVMFESVFYVGDLASNAIQWVNGHLAALVSANMAEGALRSLVVDGVIAGVGGVVTFLPQIFVLFFFIALLEDCGYMARAAYLMDKLMARVGLSGKSFIPLLSSFACAIPGIMSARVIENPRDRLLTILVAPLMSCSARFPVYALLINAFIPDVHWVPGLPGLRALVMFAMYLIGIIAAILVTLILRRTIFKGPTPPFVMELPTYKVPGIGLVVHRMWDSGWSFVQRAGTLILAVSIIIWAAAYYPRNSALVPQRLLDQQSQLQASIEQLGHESDEHLARATGGGHAQSLAWQLTKVENEIEGEYLRQSYLGRIGRVVEPLVKPLGWDWRIGCAVIASFPAREVVVATLGVIYNLGQGQDEQSADLRDSLRRATWDDSTKPVFTIPVALSVMVFFSLCAQCVSTLVVMRRETNSWRWPVFTFVYMTLLAYIGAFITYQMTTVLGIS